MAIKSAIMQMRRGLEADFDPDKMRPGEWAVSTDKKYVRMCFSVGVCVRMATYEAFEEDMEQIKEILSTCETIEEAVSKINTEVSTNAQAVAEYTEQAKKYRDEAKKFRDEAESIAGIGIATKDKAGIVKPDGTTITVDEDGTIHSAGGGGTTGTTDYSDLENKPQINGVELSGNKTLADLKITTADSKDNTVTFSQADTREKILSNEKHSTLFGKIAKWLSDLKTVAFSGSYSDLINKPSSLDTYEEIMANTESGKFAGALGVQEGFETLTNSLIEIDTEQQIQVTIGSISNGACLGGLNGGYYGNQSFVLNEKTLAVMVTACYEITNPGILGIASVTITGNVATVCVNGGQNDGTYVCELLFLNKK